MMLKIDNLVVHIDTPQGVVQAVRGVSLAIQAGQTLAIVGESGCGKSILCKSIAGILPKAGRIVQGEIVVNGQHTTQGVAMVFQDPMTSLTPTMRIGQQIAEAVLIHQDCTKAQAKQQAIDLMQLVGIHNAPQRYGQYAHQFSGGMRQRVVIAIALACKPKLLIADEPTTALDVTTQAQILDLFADIQQKTGIAILMVTHDLGVIAKIAHNVAVMYAGKLVETGRAEDIFYTPKHPYTWALLSALPSAQSASGELHCIKGMPPDLIHPPKGDAFAVRNQYALKIDYEQEPPLFAVSDTQFVASWLQHPLAPKIEPPVAIKDGKVFVKQ